MRITSTNPNFSYIISKNPSSPCFVTKMREGYLIAGFDKNDKQSYIASFVEEQGPISLFSPDKSYISTAHCPMFYLNTLSNLFRSCMNKKHELDVYSDDKGIQYDCSVSIPFMPLSNKDLLCIQYQYKEMKVEITQWPNTNKYRLTLSHKGTTVYEMLHTVQALLFVALINEEGYLNYNTDGFLDKYINSCQIAGLPYSFIYRIKENYLVKRDAFDKYKEDLEKSFIGRLNAFSLFLDNGDLLSSRRRWVESQVIEDMPLVDLGCGTGNYVYLSRRVPKYVPIDIDQGARHKISLKLEDKHVDNYEGPYASLDDYYLTNEVKGPTQYLMTEVLEHMHLDQALQLINKCIEKGKAHSLIITLPNREFNYFYPLLEENGFRHPDHKWEGDQSIINKILQYITDLGIRYTYQLSGIGDAITDPSLITHRPTYGLFIKVDP